MDVTRSNFKAVLPEVKTAISNADFIAIDCEFTGLNTGNNLNAFDTPRQYFNKIHKGSRNFLVIQFGICAFRYDKEQKAFKYRSFNFYTFPRQYNNCSPDPRFLCQASSIEFLINHEFDFNKLFKEGISYLNKADEEKQREIILEKQKSREKYSAHETSSSNAVPIPPEDIEFVESTLKQIEDFLASEEDELQLPVSNSFHRKLVYQRASEKFGPDASMETRTLENRERVIFVTKIKPPEQRQELERKRHEQEFAELEDAVGFASVIQHISQSEKLIIGHNMLLDITHIIDKFMVPVTEDYDEFKECVHSLFPKIIDTKFMSHSEHFRNSIKSSILSHMLESVQKPPFKLPSIAPEEGMVDYNMNDKREHEAGFDALMTGVCFIGMAQYIEKAEFGKNFNFHDSRILHPFLNKLFLMKIQDHPYINLTGEDVIPSRDHVLHISFPKKWKKAELVQLFSPFGNVQVAWIDSQSAFVAFNKREYAVKALIALAQSDTYQVVSYSRHQMLANASPPEVRPPVRVLQKTRDPFQQTVAESRKRTRVTSFGEFARPQAPGQGSAPSTVLAAQKKRDPDHQTTTLESRKRRRVTSFGESVSTNWKIDTIIEQPEEESPKKNKLFVESDGWD